MIYRESDKKFRLHKKNELNKLREKNKEEIEYINENEIMSLL
jgi:hypothetical protein